MALPTPRQTVPRLLSLGAITPADAQRYLDNYDFFEQNRSWIESNYPKKWAASLNQRIFAAEHLDSLRARISDEPHANRAYIEHVGG